MVKSFMSPEELMGFVDFTGDGTATVKENLICADRGCKKQGGTQCEFPSESGGGAHMTIPGLIGDLIAEQCHIIHHLKKHSGKDIEIHPRILSKGTKLIAINGIMVDQIHDGVIGDALKIARWARICVVGRVFAGAEFKQPLVSGYKISVKAYDGTPIYPDKFPFVEHSVLHRLPFVLAGEEP